MTANITIASGATTGARNVTVTNPDTTSATGTGAFTVNAARRRTRRARARAVRAPGKQTITIKGTNFVSGASLQPLLGAASRSNPPASSARPNSQPTITVESAATTGARNVTVTNPDAGAARWPAPSRSTPTPTVTLDQPELARSGREQPDHQDQRHAALSAARRLPPPSGTGITVELDQLRQLDRTHGQHLGRIGRHARQTDGHRDQRRRRRRLAANGSRSTPRRTPTRRARARATSAAARPSRSKAAASSAARRRSFGAGVTVNSTTFKSSTELIAEHHDRSGCEHGRAHRHRDQPRRRRQLAGASRSTAPRL